MRDAQLHGKLEDCPADAARAAGLRYVSDTAPGIRRVRRGGHFRYVGPDDTITTDAERLARIQALVIPPAWDDVWICADARGHLQATGRDSRGRKQYRYHTKWRTVRDETKYDRMVAFGEALEGIREQTAKDLALPGLPREKVLAAVVRLLESSLIRVGNAEYARDNKSFGLATMRDRHVDFEGTTIEFSFRGKSGKRHSIAVRDRRLANVVRRCRDIPGQQLFQYIDKAGERQSIDSADVNAYLQEVTGETFTAKDFRTWAGTVLASLALQEFASFDSEAEAKRNIVRAVERVAERLGNTPTICRKCYIHPAVLDAYLEGATLRTLQARSRESLDVNAVLRAEEAAILGLLRRRLSQAGRSAAKRNRAVKVQKR